MRLVLVLGAAVSLLGLAACGAGTTGGAADGAVHRDGPSADAPGDSGQVTDGAPPDAAPPRPTKDYVFVAADANIHRFAINRDTGELASLGATDTGVSGVGALAHRPDGRVLYATLRGSSAVRAYAVDPNTGDLSELNTKTVPGGAVYLAVTSDGKWLLSTYFSNDKAEARALAADGSLAETAAATVNTADEPHAVVLSPDGKYAFVPSRATGRVYQYAFNGITGALTANAPAYVSAPSGAGSRHFAFHPSEPYAFGSNEYTDDVTTYAYDADGGTLTKEGTVSALPNGLPSEFNAAADIHVHPSGKFVYSSNRGHDSIAVFSVGPTGALSRQENEPTEMKPRDFALDPDGRYLYAAGQDSGTVAAYSIHAFTGELTPIVTTAAPTHPEWVEVVRVELDP